MNSRFLVTNIWDDITLVFCTQTLKRYVILLQSEMSDRTIEALSSHSIIYIEYRDSRRQTKYKNNLLAEVVGDIMF